MKTKLYISLDAFDAGELVENIGADEDPKYTYQEIDMHEGQKLERKLGFNPMCSVEIDEPERRIEQIVTRLVKRGLFVALERNGKVESYMPPDMAIRDELIKISLRKTPNERFDLPGAYFTVLYSNNPYEIKDDVPKPMNYFDLTMKTVLMRNRR